MLCNYVGSGRVFREKFLLVSSVPTSTLLILESSCKNLVKMDESHYDEHHTGSGLASNRCRAEKQIQALCDRS